MQREKLIELLKNDSKKVRLKSIKKIAKKDIKNDAKIEGANAFQLNVQTNNSCSIFSPALAVYMAYNSGLKMCGIADRHTLNGVDEFIKATKSLGLKYSIGCETFLTIGSKTQRVNVYGISTQRLKKFKGIFEQNRKIAFENTITHLKLAQKEFSEVEIDINYEKRAEEFMSKGGSISIKNLYFEIGKKLIEKFGKGEKLIDYLVSKEIELDEFKRNLLLDEENAYYEYDLLRVLVKHTKQKTVQKYQDLESFSSEVRENGGFLAYVVNKEDLQDVDKMIKFVKKNNFEAICINTYNGNNYVDLLARCEKNNILLLPADYIDTPRKKFTPADCDIYDQLVENVYAVVGNQQLINDNYNGGLFSTTLCEKIPALSERIKLCAVTGKWCE